MDANITFRILFFILLGLMFIVRMIFNVRVKRQGERILPDRQAIQHEGAGVFAFRFIAFFVLIAVLVLYAIRHPGLVALDFTLPVWLRWLGALIGLVSIALTAWVELELGRQFSPQLQLRHEHRIVTSGPYARIRHPLYTALDGFGLNLALVTSNWFFLGFFILMLVGLLVRVPREERMLLDHFDEAYQIYMRSTGRFFPKM
ncbi:MAG TPA: isoprenylcysteine carboxylmethyltransferase family protein [Anaerolineales bacterium]